MHCSMLAEDAIKSAIRDYRSKKSKMAPTLGSDVPNHGLESPVAQAAT